MGNNIHILPEVKEWEGVEWIDLAQGIGGGFLRKQ
jgi:hypothetical protein